MCTHASQHVHHAHERAHATHTHTHTHTHTKEGAKRLHDGLLRASRHRRAMAPIFGARLAHQLRQLGASGVGEPGARRVDAYRHWALRAVLAQKPGDDGVRRFDSLRVASMRARALRVMLRARAKCRTHRTKTSARMGPASEGSRVHTRGISVDTTSRRAKSGAP